MQIKNKTPYAILGMLAIAPMSGYDIRQNLKESTANFWSESDGQLYPALTNLCKQKLITCRQTKTGNLNKKIYSITSQGKKILKEWLAQSPETQSVRNEALLKLFFGANISPEINKEHVEAQRYKAKSIQSSLTETKSRLIENYKDSPHLPYWLMTLDYGITMLEAKIIWCANVIKTLDKITER